MLQSTLMPSWPCTLVSPTSFNVWWNSYLFPSSLLSLWDIHAARSSLKMTSIYFLSWQCLWSLSWTSYLGKMTFPSPQLPNHFVWISCYLASISLLYKYLIYFSAFIVSFVFPEHKIALRTVRTQHYPSGQNNT